MSDVRSWSTRRGRSHELQRMEAGTGTLLLKNYQRRYDPTLHSDIKPMKRTQISITTTGVNQFVYTGFAERWPLPWDEGGFRSEVNLGLVDAFDFLGTIYLQTEHATFTTDFASTGAPNADLTFTARGAGIDGNALSVMYWGRPWGPAWGFSVQMIEPSDGIKFITTGGAPDGGQFHTPIKPLVLVVQMGKTGNQFVTTAKEIMDATNAHPVASRYLRAELAPGSDGSEVPTHSLPQGSYLYGDSVPLTGGTYESMLSGERINTVLDFVGWPSNERSIDPGSSVVPGAGYDIADQQTAMQHMQDIADAEGGYIFIGANGYFTFHDRTRRPKNAAPAAVFGDGGPGSGEIKYQQIEASYDRDEIRNDITVEIPNGFKAHAEDAQSIAEYGRRNYRVTPALTSEIEAQAFADYFLYRYKDPHLRIESMRVRPVSFDEWQAVVLRRLGDRVTVVRRPPELSDPRGTPIPQSAPIVQDCFIEQIEWSAVPGVYDVTFQLSPADQDQFALFDDPLYGIFDVSRFGI